MQESRDAKAPQQRAADIRRRVSLHFMDNQRDLGTYYATAVSSQLYADRLRNWYV